MTEGLCCVVQEKVNCALEEAKKDSAEGAQVSFAISLLTSFHGVLVGVVR